MNKAMKITLAVVLVVVLATIGRQRQTLSQEQRQIQTLTMALADKSKQELLVSQAQCSDMANKFLTNRTYYKNTDDYQFDFENHFNAKLNKCFVLIFESSLPKSDFLSINLFDAVEGKRYAEFEGHSFCDVHATNDPRRCSLDAGKIWFDGNDTRNPPDVTVGFRGLLFGGGHGDENTKKMFLDHIQSFMKD
jgi:hypothetical protein